MIIKLGALILSNPKNYKKYATAGFVTLPVVKANLKAEMDYRRELLGLVNLMQAAINSRLLPKLKRYEIFYSRLKKLTDTSILIDADWQDELNTEMDDIGTSFVEYVKKVAQAKATKFANDSESANWSSFYKSFNDKFGIAFESYYNRDDDLLKSLINENIDLITSIPAQHLAKVKAMTLRNIADGQSYRNLVDDIQEVFKLTKSRAKLIARDQAGKVNSAISDSRAINLGCEEYVWSGAKDNRERKTHLANEGQTFSLKKPPPNGNRPGYEILCRCVALWVVRFDPAMLLTYKPALLAA